MLASSTRGPRIVVVGGSIAGLFSAALLTRAGYDVQVFERSAQGLAGRGAGIVTHPELFAALARAGIAVDPADLGVSVPGRRVLDVSGRILGERALPQVLAGWGRVYDLLLTSLPPGLLHLGANIVEVVASGEAVTARFDDGRTVLADLLVGADGLFSAVRRQLLPATQPVFAGYVAWRGLAEEADLSAETREALCDRFAFCLPPGEQMLGYPVSGAGEDTRPGRRRFNFVWYRPASADELGRLLTDTSGVRHELSIPPNRIRPEVLAAMRDASERLLAPAFAEVVRAARQPFLQAILDLEASTMAPASRVALIGDAAFVARPHVGMGVTKAATDAVALVDALDASGGEVGPALARFDRARRPYGAAIVAHSRALGAYMQAQLLSAEERSAAERHRRPDAVMAETAVAPRFAES